MSRVPVFVMAVILLVPGCKSELERIHQRCVDRRDDGACTELLQRCGAGVPQACSLRDRATRAVAAQAKLELLKCEQGHRPTCDRLLLEHGKQGADWRGKQRSSYFVSRQRKDQPSGWTRIMAAACELGSAEGCTRHAMAENRRLLAALQEDRSRALPELRKNVEALVRACGRTAKTKACGLASKTLAMHFLNPESDAEAPLVTQSLERLCKAKHAPACTLKLSYDKRRNAVLAARKNPPPAELESCSVAPIRPLKIQLSLKNISKNVITGFEVAMVFGLESGKTASPPKDAHHFSNRGRFVVEPGKSQEEQWMVPPDARPDASMDLRVWLKSVRFKDKSKWRALEEQHITCASGVVGR